MKKTLIAAVALAFGLGANAAVEKVATIQVADKNALIQAATAAGNLVGYPMLGMMATMGLAENPINAELGEFRPGESALGVVYVDIEKVAKLDDVDDAFGGFAFVYAPTKSKQDFLLSHEDAVETDGVIKFEKDAFLVYSEDGKWAAVGSSAEFAKNGLAEAAVVQKPLDGDFARLAVLKPGMKLYSMAIAEAMKEFEETGVSNVKAMPTLLATIEAIDSFDVSLGVNDAGLAVRGSFLPVAGSDLSKLCVKPLEGDALAFAPADAIIATSAAEGSGFDAAAGVGLYDGIVAAIKEGGVNTDWYKSASEGTTYKIVCDVAAAVKYFMSEEGQTAAAAVDTNALQAKVQSLYNEDMCKINPASKPYSFSLSIPKTDSKASMSALFAKVLPEAAAKKPAAVSVYRYYSTIKALAPEFAALIPQDGNASLISAGISTLPTDDDAAIATAIYREGDSIAFSARASAQEIRGFTAVVNAIIAYAAMSNAENCACEDDDDDADEDLSDDEDEE